MGYLLLLWIGILVWFIAEDIKQEQEAEKDENKG
jgi:hypothetical protein